MATKLLKVCKKAVTTKDNRTFDAIFAYRQEMNEDNIPVDVLTPVTTADGKADMVAKSIRVALTGEAKKKLIAHDNFPYLLVLEDGRDLEGKVCEDLTPDFYVTKDKDKDGNVRLDKNGKSHIIAIISDYREATHVEPMNSLSLDDIDNY